MFVYSAYRRRYKIPKNVLDPIWMYGVWRCCVSWTLYKYACSILCIYIYIYTFRYMYFVFSSPFHLLPPTDIYYCYVHKSVAQFSYRCIGTASMRGREHPYKRTRK